MLSHKVAGRLAKEVTREEKTHKPPDLDMKKEGRRRRKKVPARKSKRKDVANASRACSLDWCFDIARSLAGQNKVDAEKECLSVMF